MTRLSAVALALALFLTLGSVHAQGRRPQPPRGSTQPKHNWNPTRSDAEVEKLADLGFEHHTAERYEEECNTFLSVLRRKPDHLPVLLQLAVLYTQREFSVKSCSKFHLAWAFGLLEKYYPVEMTHPGPTEEIYRTVAKWAAGAGNDPVWAVKLHHKRKELMSPEPVDVDWHFDLAGAYLYNWDFEDAIKHYRAAFKGGRPTGKKNMHSQFATALLYAANPERIEEAKKVLLYGLNSKSGLDGDSLFLLSQLYHKNKTMDFDLSKHAGVKRHVIRDGWVSKRSINEYAGTKIIDDFKIPEYVIKRDANGVPDWSAVHECERKRTPCLFRAEGDPRVGGDGKKDHNMASMLGWNTDNWDDKYLERHVGHVPMYLEARTKIGTAFGTSHAYQVRPMKEILKSFDQREKGVYLGLKQDMDKVYQPPLDTLEEDIPMPSFLKRPTFNSRMDQDDGTVNWAHMWMSGPQAKNVPRDVNSTSSMLHVDPYDNINCLIKGKKIFKLFSPDSAQKLYIAGKIRAVDKYGNIKYSYPTSHAGLNFALVDPTDPDLELYPLFAETKSVDVTLEGGDMFFLPVGWFHQVTTWGPSLGINFWYTAQTSETGF